VRVEQLYDSASTRTHSFGAAMTPKMFTIEKARETLPLVQQITRDIVDFHLTLEGLKDKVRKESRRYSRFKLDELEKSGQQSRKIQDQRGLIEKKLADLQRELEQLGCALLDGPRGVVGYPAFLGNELVHYCWLYGEIDISSFCRGRDSYKKRQPIPNAESTSQASSETA
jgi:hypothetical protein